MPFSQFFTRLTRSQGWQREILFTALALAFGFALMPVLIFYAGSLLLGRYEGASVAHLFQSIYRGFQAGSPASWIVLLGPYALYLLFRIFRLWWRLSAKLA